MVEHAQKVKPVAKPLTTAALQKFLETVENEVYKSRLKDETKVEILRAVAVAALPIDTSGKYGFFSVVIHNPPSGKYSERRNTLPSTLAELQSRVQPLVFGFEAKHEESHGPSSSALMISFEKGLKAAAREMERDTSHPR